MRLRELGIAIGLYPVGPRNSITDVSGVLVGHATIVRGDGPLRIGHGPVRTGLTVVIPHEGDTWTEPRFAGTFTLNGSGEWTGLHYVRENGTLYGNIHLTNSHSVGTVRDAVIKRESRRRGHSFVTLPIVGETSDDLLNDMAGLHVRPEHLEEALTNASVDVAEGGVGGGTGMICHGYKGGIGTSSRVVESAGLRYTLGVLVQANHGSRESLIVDGIRFDRLADRTAEASHGDRQPNHAMDDRRNSILIVVATDAPLLPHQCERLAHRATLGVALNGATGGTMSGDFALAFSTFDQQISDFDWGPSRELRHLHALNNASLNPFFEAVVEATQEAILNALAAAEPMTGRDGFFVPALDTTRLRSRLGSGRPTGDPVRDNT